MRTDYQKCRKKRLIVQRDTWRDRHSTWQNSGWTISGMDSLNHVQKDIKVLLSPEGAGRAIRGKATEEGLYSAMRGVSPYKQDPHTVDTNPSSKTRREIQRLGDPLGSASAV